MQFGLVTDTGVVVGDRQAAERLRGIAEDPVDRVRVAHVYGVRRSTEFRRRLRYGVVVDVEQYDGCALLDEALRRRQPDAGGAPCDDGLLAVEQTHQARP